MAEQVKLEGNQFDAYNKINANKLTGNYTSQKLHKLLIIGDSQARDFINILIEAKLDDRDQIRYLKTNAKCQPMLGINYNEFANHIPEALRSQCRQDLAQSEKDPRIALSDGVVLVANWRMWSADLIPRVVSYLKTRGAKRILVVGSKAQIKGGIDANLEINATTGVDESNKERQKPNMHTQQINLNLAEHAKAYEFMDLTKLFCTERDGCRYLTPSGKAILWDTMHLTQEGARYLAARLIKETNIDEW